jgi:hypothetical protein
MTPPINSEGVFHPGHVPRAPSVPRFNARDDAARLRAIALELASPVADAINEVAGRMEDGAYAERVMVLGRSSDVANDAAKLRAAATRMSYGNTPDEAKQKHILNETAMRIETGAYGPAAASKTEGEYTGGSVNYYKVRIEHPTTIADPYEAECNDIIEALGMSFAEGNAFKAIWRLCAARKGARKRGYDHGLYDAEKVVFFGQRMVEQAKAEAK